MTPQIVNMQVVLSQPRTAPHTQHQKACRDPAAVVVGNHVEVTCSSLCLHLAYVTSHSLSMAANHLLVPIAQTKSARGRFAEADPDLYGSSPAEASPDAHAARPRITALKQPRSSDTYILRLLVLSQPFKLA